jgi:hypothetical protein
MNSTSFIFRTLQESELESWFDHCAAVFAKKTDREHFVRHWFAFNSKQMRFSTFSRFILKNNLFYGTIFTRKCDPERDMNGIFVAIDPQQNNQIAATVRVFFRQMKIGEHTFKMGGIGEVSTKEPYRHRGLATKLLHVLSFSFSLSLFFLYNLSLKTRTACYAIYEREGN